LKNKKLFYFILAGLVFLAWVGWIVSKEVSNNKLEVVFFDVGQGDSIFIETPNNFQVLIDGGPSSAVLEKLGKEMPFYDRTIDLIVLTHPDYDHVSGLLEVLKSYKVKNILWTGVVKNTAEYEEWVKLIEKEKANVMLAMASQEIILQKEPLIYFKILYPFESLENQKIEDSNNTSIVAKLIFNDKSFLFMGDISCKIEKQLVEVDADILKIGHHGSNNSSCQEFIERVSPETAVISVGENKWGHPSSEVLQRLKQFGIDVLITKELGDIKFSL